MLFDASASEGVPSSQSADLVIVGAGTVGLFLASAMSEATPRLNILIVEAGSKVAGAAGNARNSASIGKRHEGVHLGRASGLGGTSSLWGGQLAEFSESDLRRDDVTWPISFMELQRYYRRVYERLDVGNPESVGLYRKEFGGEIGEAESIERFFTYWLKEPNFAKLYERLIRTNPSIRVIVNLTANRLSFDGENARSLRCTGGAGREIHIRAKRYVFASGTIATSRFFLSTQRFGQVPWVSNDNVGRYFQDHLGGKIAGVEVLDETRFRNYFENGWVKGVKLQPKLTLSRRRRQVLRSGACGIFTFDSSISENIANLKGMVRSIKSGMSFSSASSRAADVLVVGRSLIPIVSRYMRNRRIFAVFDQGVTFHVQAEQIPLSRSCIKLSGAEPLQDGLYPIVVDWQCDGGELAAIYDFATQSDLYLRRHGLARLTIEPALQRKDEVFIESLGDTYHQCGGMRMSATAATGVVNSEGRVWGTANVWVTGTALLPSSGHANCTLTGLAMTARLSEHLTQ